MIKITKIEVLDNYLLHLFFDDNTDKVVDVKKFIINGTISENLLDNNYFKQVLICDNGRGIYWPNGYDLCPDTLRYYTEAFKELV